MGAISHHTMSLDGFIAGPDDSMDWAFGYGEATFLADETMNRIGAILAGRRWYELATERWNGVDGIYGPGTASAGTRTSTARPASSTSKGSVSEVIITLIDGRIGMPVPWIHAS